MSKKISLTMLFALLLAGWFSGVALAADEDPDLPVQVILRPHRVARGEILAIDLAANSFDVRSLRGETLTFIVDEGTRIHGQVGSLADLEPGMHAVVQARRRGDGTLFALQVFVHERLDQIRVYRGKIMVVTESAITLVTPRQDLIKFTIDDQTHYRGIAEDWTDVEPGQFAVVSAFRQENGNLKARIFRVPEKPPVRRFVGKISKVDLTASAFSLKTRRDTFTISLDAETVLWSLGGEVQGLEDFMTGMRSMVVATNLGDGTYQAKLLFIGSPPKR